MKHTLLFLLTAALLTACGSGSRRAEINQRRQALRQKQATELRAAQQRLAAVDSMLEQAKLDHDAQHQWVMDHATQLDDHSSEVQRLNQLRQRRDSLQAEWHTLGAKIKYIRQKQKELDEQTPAQQ